MSYCGGWISDYHFTKALRFRLAREGSAAGAVATSPTQSLLLWGGADSLSAPYLEPTFVVDASAALPDSAGDYRITGQAGNGAELFSLSFTMPEGADGDGGSSFAFVLPVQARWEASLATITLSGPGGTATLDGNSDLPMAILRDPQTRQVRGFVRDGLDSAATQADAVEIVSPGPGLQVRFSRGIPDPGAWRR